MTFDLHGHRSLDARKLVAVAVGAAVGSAALLQYAAGGVLGQGGPELEAVVAALVFYVVVSFPKRMEETSSLLQSREAPTLAVMASVGFEATHSRARTVMMLRATDPTISEVLREIRRKVLLGSPVESAVEERGSELSSFSVASVLKGAATLSAGSIEEGGEETQGMMSAYDLAEESKLPLFIAICFFSPILLLLYAVFAHLTDPGELAELVAVQIVLLDLGFYFSSTARGRLA